MLITRRAAAFALAITLMAATPAVADDPVFSIEFKDGVVTPSTLEVPANTRFKIEVHNTGATPAEFESSKLQREKVVGPGANSFVVIRSLDPGEYSFFDDFHPGTPPGKLIAT